MYARFHRRVQHDLDEILERYDSISELLADDFFAEFQLGVETATGNPRFFHHDASGLRVGFVFNRGMPLMLWEDAFGQRFSQMHNADAKTVEDDDPRIHATRAAIMTDFMQEVRALLDETAAKQGRTVPYKISLGTFAKEADNQRWGLDLPTWIQRGLVDDLAVTWFAYHTSFEKTPARLTWTTTSGSPRAPRPGPTPWSSHGRPANRKSFAQKPPPSC